MVNEVPSIEEIVRRRILAGIADVAETMWYLTGDLDDAEFSDETKERLWQELLDVHAGQ